MARQLKTGDRVSWQSSGGGSVGRVERELKSPGKIAGHEVAASEDTIVAMSAYFARHEVDKASKSHEWGDEANPSAGYIAWLLWGGEPGRRWADGMKSGAQQTAAE